MIFFYLQISCQIFKETDPVIEDFVGRMEFTEGDKLILPCKGNCYE